MLLPAPPYRLADATLADFGLSPPIVAGDRVYAQQGGMVLAYGLPRLRLAWKRRLSDGSLVLGHDLVLCGRGTPLVGLDPKTGAVRWSLPHRQGPSAMAFDAQTLYVSLDNYTLTALDLRTHRPRWTRRLSEKRASDYFTGNVGTLALSRGTLLGLFDETFFAIDAATGRRLWAVEGVFHTTNAPLPIAGDTVWISHGGGSECRDVHTGAVRWRSSAGASAFSVSWQGRFVAANAGRVTAVDPATGRTLWSRTIGDERISMGGPGSGTLGDTLFALGSERLLALAPDGRVRWSQAGRFNARPIWSDGRTVVAFDGERFLRYVRARRSPERVSDRRALARRLVARFARLDVVERARLVRLGDAAFTPLLQAFVKACAVRDRMRGGDVYAPEARADDLDRALEKVAAGHHAPALLSVLRRSPVGGYARPILLARLAKVGGPSLAARAAVEVAKASPASELGWNILLASHDPVAVGYLVAVLRDPNAPPDRRAEAYRHLAGTGGDAGLRAVLAARPRRPSSAVLRPPTTDAERILAASLVAFAFGEARPVRLARPEGVEPFEIDAPAGPAVWTGETSVERLSFAPVSPGTKGIDRLIAWNPARTEATVGIDRYGAGYRATLRRLGGEWVVVAMRLAWQN